ncbi:hypothetical protein BT69DRAFT_1292298 [Atractiella rhizophila]|nr:hypothetical protein BT69DRAFT_1292298 [Atractiella rhizophila]
MLFEETIRSYASSPTCLAVLCVGCTTPSHVPLLKTAKEVSKRTMIGLHQREEDLPAELEEVNIETVDLRSIFRSFHSDGDEAAGVVELGTSEKRKNEGGGAAEPQAKRAKTSPVAELTSYAATDKDPIAALTQSSAEPACRIESTPSNTQGTTPPTEKGRDKIFSTSDFVATRRFDRVRRTLTDCPTPPIRMRNYEEGKRRSDSWNRSSATNPSPQPAAIRRPGEATTGREPLVFQMPPLCKRYYKLTLDAHDAQLRQFKDELRHVELCSARKENERMFIDATGCEHQTGAT